MSDYKTPGVYVEEISSLVQPIVGVGTSTAAFIGVFPDTFKIPTTPLIQVQETITEKKPQTTDTYKLKYSPVATSSFEIKVDDQIDDKAKLSNEDNGSYVKLSKEPGEKASISGTYFLYATKVSNELLGKGIGQIKAFNLKGYPVREKDNFSFKVNGAENSDVTLKNDDQKQLAIVTFGTAPTEKQTVTGDYALQFPDFISVAEKEVKLCTSFSEFKKFFGDFSIEPGQQQLAHAVYGFFKNGGTRCYVTRVKDKTDIKDVLTKLEVIDEISLVVAPGTTDSSARNNIVDHCKNMGDRFAIFDSEEDPTAINAAGFQLIESDYAAFYFPWIQVFDPATKALDPNGTGLIFVPPSGHIAGIYARVDAQRGIHKAPANEVVSGAVGVKQAISKNQQDGLNTEGINCIRVFNGSIKVWGARTLSQSNELRYINVRRTLLFLRESIDEGTQWAVFEPNTPALWQKIKRNVFDFLLVQWRAGILFGNTEREAFYVKCDAETNPPTEVALGRVIAEVGLSIVRPAEFVIFHISQTTLPS